MPCRYGSERPPGRMLLANKPWVKTKKSSDKPCLSPGPSTASKDSLTPGISSSCEATGNSAKSEFQKELLKLVQIDQFQSNPFDG